MGFNCKFLKSWAGFTKKIITHWNIRYNSGILRQFRRRKNCLATYLMCYEKYCMSFSFISFPSSTIKHKNFLHEAKIEKYYDIKFCTYIVNIFNHCLTHRWKNISSVFLMKYLINLTINNLNSVANQKYATLSL